MPIRHALVIAPFTDENLSRAAQIGVTDIVHPYPGDDVRELVLLQERVKSFGMKITVIERKLPIERIKLRAPGTDEDIEKIQRLIRNMAACDIRILCYNFMAGGDWSRTNFYEKERGGCTVSSFEGDLYKNVRVPESEKIDGETLWKNLEYFMDKVLPVAEECGVVLAMHPDDPPVPEVLGKARIMWNPECFDRLLKRWPSPSNKIAFCQGTFTTMGIDIPSTIRRFKDHVVFVHFRDVIGSGSRFKETWQDNGKTDMFEAMKTWVEVGFNGPMRPDHVPVLAGEEASNDGKGGDSHGGYTFLGRLFAIGYMRGLQEAAEKLLGKPSSKRIYGKL